MPNNDVNKDKLLYVPKTEPVRNYESKGQFQDAYIPIDDNEEQIVPNRLSISEDLVEVRDLIDFLPDGLSFIKDILNIIIERQKIIEDSMSNTPDNNISSNDNNIDENIPSTEKPDFDYTDEDADIPNIDDNTSTYPNEITPDTPDKEQEDIVNSNPENTYNEGSLSEGYEINTELPDMFTEPTDIKISFIPPKTLVQIAQEDYQRDTLDLNEYYLQTLQVVLQQYFQEVMTVMQECGISDLSNLIRHFDGDTVSVAKSDLRHLKDYIIRSQITREQKTRMFKKTHNVDNTLIHMRTWHAAEQERERYYTENYGDSDTFLNSQSNALLRECRSSYDKNYTNALYNMYKYLNSSALLIGDILTMTSKEAQAKGKLIKEGVDIFVSKETAKQQKVTQQIAEYEAQQNKQATDANANSSNKNNSDNNNENTSSDNANNETNTMSSTNTTEKELKEQKDNKQNSASNTVQNILDSIKSDTQNIFTIGGGILGNNK